MKYSAPILDYTKKSSFLHQVFYPPIFCTNPITPMGAKLIAVADAVHFECICLDTGYIFDKIGLIIYNSAPVNGVTIAIDIKITRPGYSYPEDDTTESHLLLPETNIITYYDLVYAGIIMIPGGIITVEGIVTNIVAPEKTYILGVMLIYSGRSI